MKIGNKEINKDDSVRVTFKNVLTQPFKAKVINVYSHSVVLESLDGIVFDCEWDEVERIN